MASQQGQEHDRGFREVVLGRCFVQTCVDRVSDFSPLAERGVVFALVVCRLC